MFESLYKHTLVGVLPILQYHIYNTYYELRLTYTRLIILILVYSIIQLSLLLRSIKDHGCGGKKQIDSSDVMHVSKM